MKAYIKMVDEMTGATVKIPCEIDMLIDLLNVQTRNITTFEIEVDNGKTDRSGKEAHKKVNV